MTNRNDLLVVVYAIEKFEPYLLFSKVIIYTGHFVRKHFLDKAYSKPQLIWEVVLL